jgi:hypothetical protein
MRVHVVDDEVHATEIVSDTLGYRYARGKGGNAMLRAAQPSAEITARCVALARGLGLAFAGVDFKFVPDGQIDCCADRSVTRTPTCRGFTV